MNRVIELHDTEVVGIITVGDQVIVFLDAYVHQSAGSPGRDPGTGWGQAAVLLFNQGTVDGDLPDPRVYVKRGTINLADAHSSALVPIPLNHIGPVTLILQVTGSDGSYEEVKVTGERVDLVLIGEPVYVEEFPG